MAALNNSALLAQNDVFANRCLAALVYQAAVVITESAPNPVRKGFAQSVLLNPKGYKDMITYVLASRPMIASQTVAAMTAVAADMNASGPEGILLQEVTVVWDVLAGLVVP